MCTANSADVSNTDTTQEESRTPVLLQIKRYVSSLLKSSLFIFMSSAISTILLLYLILPVIFYNSHYIRSRLIFQTFLHRVPKSQLASPSNFGLECSQHFKVNVSTRGSLGAWYVAPKRKGCSVISDRNITIENQSADGDYVVLYLHGTTGTRGKPERVDLYRLLQQMGFHVFSFDYRGFADSSQGALDISELVEDSVAMYNMIVSLGVNPNRIILWGHSMGSGVANYLAAELSKQHGQSQFARLLVLEAPFDYMHNAVEASDYVKYHRFMPYFWRVIMNPIRSSTRVNFNSISQSKAVSVNLPVLMLATIDDKTVPYMLTYKLYKSFLMNRQSKPRSGVVRLITFGMEHQLGHRFIHRYKALDSIIESFLKEC